MTNPRPKQASHRGRRPASVRRGTKVGRDIIDSLTALRDALRDGEPLERRFTVRTVRRVPEPGTYDADRVRRTRERIGASQPVFASLVGVSTVLVRSWEQGVRTPAPIARRLLDEINRDPRRWAGMIKLTSRAA